MTSYRTVYIIQKLRSFGNKVLITICGPVVFDTAINLWLRRRRNKEIREITKVPYMYNKLREGSENLVVWTRNEKSGNK